MAKADAAHLKLIGVADTVLSCWEAGRVTRRPLVCLFPCMCPLLPLHPAARGAHRVFAALRDDLRRAEEVAMGPPVRAHWEVGKMRTVVAVCMWRWYRLGATRADANPNSLPLSLTPRAVGAGAGHAQHAARHGPRHARPARDSAARGAEGHAGARGVHAEGPGGLRQVGRVRVGGGGGRGL